MVERADVLLTLAEIAIAFAGFASLAAVLGRGRARDDPRFDAWRLRNVLEAALTVALFALFPFLPHGFGLDPSATWRLSALAFLIWSLVSVYMSSRRARALPRTGSPVYLAVFAGMELCIDLPLLAVVWGVFAPVAPALYLVALVMSLVQAGLFFIRLVSSLLTGVAD